MYVGLLIGSKEPPYSKGYARVCGDFEQTLTFPVSSGYGLVTSIALFENEIGGVPTKVVELPQPVDCHDGVIPIIHNRQLLRGLDVTAQINVAISGCLNT